MLTTILVYVGAAVLALLCHNDFRTRLVRCKTTLHYWVCFAMFLAFNALVFLTLCTIILKVDASKLLAGGHGILDSDRRSVLPIVTAFGYFGLGSVPVPFGQEIKNLYGVILEVLKRVFGARAQAEHIRSEVKRLERETRQLKEAVEEFNETGQKRGWSLLPDQWDELKRDDKTLEGEISTLESIRDQLGAGILTTARVEGIRRETGTRVDEMRSGINLKLKKHLLRLVGANDEDPAALDEIANLLQVAPPTPTAAPSHLPELLSRAFVFSLVAGIAAGCVSTHLQGRPDQAIDYIWRWMLSVAAFGSVLACTGTLRRKNVAGALAVGFLAGLGAQTVWILAGAWISHGPSPEKSFADLLPRLVYGVSFGAASGALLHWARHCMRVKLRSQAACFACLGLAGAALFGAVGLVLPGLGNYVESLALIGVLITLATGFSTGVFKPPRIPG